ncbi:Cob(I)yrinic acid a,c-diamide adenosyltransferase [Sedimentisphaera cyanobacteriorum]|uniref:corrinoid adenosyltransferase n=1 Tax=Sedimentisphaera cyanobacteriorum TaxID=1940790 RepID=A0A1Q2HMX0_9BACT|nr:cob(I)yrinic acid a,c-diamide adenosyltransferase [Sedimentisphaera cyanobacteriorum]AQQ08817.1 Cob(I)yrinic acid a,c-diamide adenosyltransferase [Sedimentisphaera cyanobacteriorum]
MIENGLVQIYTGEGKGKTTAALGLSLRAAGDGNRVLFAQYLKPENLQLCERKAIEQSKLPIDFKTIDIDWNMWSSPDNSHERKKAAELIEKSLADIDTLTSEGVYNVVVLDEIIYCLNIGLASLGQLKRMIDRKAVKVEIVLTGRGAKDEIIELADLVSDIECVKHPYNEGFRARKGIEY